MNSGKKIKSLAVILYRIGVIGYILIAIIMIIIGSNNYEETITVWGVIILIAGPLLSIANSLIIYGFGELIDKVCIIERNICGEESKSTYNEESKSAYTEENKSTCGEENKFVTHNTKTGKFDKLSNLLSKGLTTDEKYKK